MKKGFEKKIKNYLKSSYCENYREASVRKVIKKSHEIFYEQEEKRLISYAEFVYQQSHYIHKYWWILQAGILSLLWLLLQITDSSFFTQRSMGLLASLFAMLIVPELWKNKGSASMEIEGTSFYSLRQVYSARILLFALVDMILLSTFSLVTILDGNITIAHIMINFFLPFMVTCCICFRTLCSNKIESEYMTVILCLVWIAIWLIVILDNDVYSAVAMPIWGLLLSGATIYLVFCIRNTVKNCEKIWEGNITWN